jgi:hypothetical protein
MWGPQIDGLIRRPLTRFARSIGLDYDLDTVHPGNTPFQLALALSDGSAS